MSRKGIPHSKEHTAKLKAAALRRWRKELPPIPQDIHEMIEGLIGSDAYLSRSSPEGQSAMNVVSKFIEFRDHLASRLSSCGFSPRLDTRPVNGKDYYWVTTDACVNLIPYHERWYGGGPKHLPDDFAVTKSSMLYWYLGDGGLNKHGGATTVRIATYAFSSVSTVRLANSIMSAIGNVAKVYWHDGPVIYMAAQSARDFLEYIGPSPVKCFDYKWDTNEVKTSDADLVKWPLERLIAIDESRAQKRIDRDNNKKLQRSQQG